jgi:hypothetical protein
MKIEFLAEGSKNCPLIRLYEFDQGAALRLKELVSALAARTATSTSLHKQPWIEAIDDCKLELRLAIRDQGVIQVGPLRFEFVLSSEGWTDVDFLLDPFCDGKPSSGFQWLSDRGKISLLISSNGKW